MLKFLTAIFTALLIVTSPVSAGDKLDWTPLNGSQIEEVLADASLVFPGESGATQDFKSDGSTVWVQGRPSSGEWKVSDKQYCSVWPPSASWVCYDVTINELRTAVRFIGESGKIYEGIFQ